MAWQPAREVELVAGTPAGGGQDRPARALIRVLDDHSLVGMPVRLVNLPGRGGSNGWDHLNARPGEPHLLGISSPPLLTNKLLGVAAIDHEALTPLAILYTEYIAFVVSSDSALSSGHALLERLRDPGALRIALATARGNTNHIALALCTRHAGGAVKALNLQVFDSALYAAAAVVEGRADVAVITAISAVDGLIAGTLRALAVSAPQRMAGAFAAVPTWREQGVDCATGTWRGVVAPARLAADHIAFWDSALKAAAASAQWNEQLQQHYWANTYRDSAATRRFLAGEQRVLQDALADIGLIAPR